MTIQAYSFVALFLLLATAPLLAGRTITAASKSARKRAHHHQEPTHMDKDRIIGAGKQVVGTLKQAIGRIVGDIKLQADGKAQQMEGKAQNAIGGLKDTVKP